MRTADQPIRISLIAPKGRMGQAIEQLVDPPTLARRLLQASADLCGAAQGSVYLREGDPPLYRLVGSLGAVPPSLSAPSVRVPAAVGLSATLNVGLPLSVTAPVVKLYGNPERSPLVTLNVLLPIERAPKLAESEPETSMLESAVTTTLLA